MCEKQSDETEKALDYSDPDKTLVELFDLLREELIDLDPNPPNPSTVNSLPNQNQLKVAARELLHQLDLAYQVRDIGHEL